MSKTHTWKIFSVYDFFTTRKGNQKDMSSLLKGDIPLVSAKNTGNGYKAFVSVPEAALYPGGILTLNNDGDGGAGISYYQPAAMALDTHVTALIPKLRLNRYHLLFISACLNKQRKGFGHGRPISEARLRTYRFLLPCKDGITPDWEYMENCMWDIESRKYAPFLEHIAKRL